MIFQTEAIRIAKDLISSYFPELGSSQIKFVFVSGKEHDYYMATNWLIFVSRIFIEKEALKFSPQAFTGHLAHELANLVIDKKKPFLRRLQETFY